jgi:hypothetical protein
VVPPEQAVWLPGGEIHSVHMTLGPVSTRSAFVWPDAVPGLPDLCQVLGMSPLMQHLLIEAADVPLEYDPASRDGLLFAAPWVRRRIVISRLERAAGHALAITSQSSPLNQRGHDRLCFG